MFKTVSTETIDPVNNWRKVNKSMFLTIETEVVGTRRPYFYLLHLAHSFTDGVPSSPWASQVQA